MNDKEILEAIEKILNKAVVEDIKVYDMRKVTPYYDYAVIGSVLSSRQGAAAMDYLDEESEENGLHVRSISGGEEATWFLADMGTVFVHVFVGSERERYNLDQLYQVSANRKIENNKE